jgi:two-component system response regulator PilR (NtrC family)
MKDQDKTKAQLLSELDALRRRVAILEALEKTRYNRTQAARILGVTFRSMRYRMERLGIQ